MKSSLRIIFSIIIIFTFGSSSQFQEEIYKNKKALVEERVNDLLSRLTLEEKIDLLGGTGFESKPIERFNLPELKMADGPIGVRWGEATALPSGIALASTWDTTLANQYGKILAIETKGKGRNVILGPCVNIARLPMGGRNFESFGEDPHLTSRLAVNYIKGVQNENVVATIKHFACNNHEHERDFVDIRIDKRTLNELYLPHFKAAVEEANVWAVMSSYNKVNGSYASENDYLLIDKLKKEWGFKGLVMSDWGAVHSTIPTALSGLDIEMPNGKYLNKETLIPAIKKGLVSENVIDEKVKRILRVIFESGIYDNDYTPDEKVISNEASKTLAYNVAKDAVILLKNEENILPINKNQLKSIAVIGTSGMVARTGGGGSSMVSPSYAISPYEALKNKLPNEIKLNYAPGVPLDGDTQPIDSKFLFQLNKTDRGLNAEYFENKNLEGNPKIKKVDNEVNFNWGNNPPFVDFPKDNYSVRWSGYVKPDKSGIYTFDIISDDGVRFYFEDKKVIDDWNDHSAASNSYSIELKKDEFYKIRLEYYENGGDAIVSLGWREQNNDLIKDAVSLAKSSDIVLLFAGTSFHYESEGKDRNDLLLPNNQDELIKKISEVNKNTIVILNVGSPVLMDSWLNDVKGLVLQWFSGSEVGNAIADVLLGNVNPSGKLPVTIGKRWEDYSPFNTYKKIDSVSYYSDGVFVGYRHFDYKKIIPLFPFGYGLSYTQFKYEKLNLSAREMSANQKIDISFDITNIGKSKGKEIVQLYIRDIKSSVERPYKELKSFSKIELNPGEKKHVTMQIDKNMLTFFDDKSESFIAELGEFEILIGSSSQQIELKDKFTLKK
ncbi:MAG TPA: glycoside hydrolase family 3 C-terminal domain-containing protein [Ignavibacteriaceae bacterium]|nr:glycoside hydrolase family 3 C-terminal domain-containing protein [Ignavibacteriaceae bacterium]